MALDTRFACRRYSPPQNPNPIREGGCSGGKRHHAITGPPSPLCHASVGSKPLHHAGISSTGAPSPQESASLHRQP